MSRPLFLSVICIITFVFSSLGLLGSIWGCAPSTIESGLVAMLEMQAKELDFVVFNESEYLKWTFYSNVAGIVGGILCVIGALAMWRLKKNGYYIYIIGYLVTTVVGFFSHVIHFYWKSGRNGQSNIYIEYFCDDSLLCNVWSELEAHEMICIL